MFVTSLSIRLAKKRLRYWGTAGRNSWQQLSAERSGTFLSKDSSLKSSSKIGAKPLGRGAKGRAKHLSLTHNAVPARVSAYQGIPYAIGSVGSEVGELQNDSSDCVSRDDLAIERGAQFWRSL